MAISRLVVNDQFRNIGSISEYTWNFNGDINKTKTIISPAYRKFTMFHRQTYFNLNRKPMFYFNESNQNCNRRFIMFRPRTKEEGGSKVESIEKEGLHFADRKQAHRI